MTNHCSQFFPFPCEFPSLWFNIQNKEGTMYYIDCNFGRYPVDLINLNCWSLILASDEEVNLTTFLHRNYLKKESLCGQFEQEKQQKEKISYDHVNIGLRRTWKHVKISFKHKQISVELLLLKLVRVGMLTRTTFS